MKNSISGLLAGLLATGCASLPSMKGNPQDRDVNYVIEEGKETEYFEGKSDFTVILFPEDHFLYGCQANIYLALEKRVLGGEVRFVAREGRYGPTEHDSGAFQTKMFFDRNLQIRYYKDLIDLPYAQRQEAARSWVMNNDFPSQYWRNSFTLRPIRDWNQVMPMMATVLNEAVNYQVHTVGVEDPKAHDRADKELAKADEAIGKARNILSKAYIVEEQDKKYFANCGGKIDTTKLTEEEFARCRRRLINEKEDAFMVVRDETTKYRNAAMVPNIQKWANKLSFVEGDLVLFSIGELHVPDLAQRLKEAGISSRVVEHKACKEEIPFYLF